MARQGPKKSYVICNAVYFLDILTYFQSGYTFTICSSAYKYGRVIAYAYSK